MRFYAILLAFILLFHFGMSCISKQKKAIAPALPTYVYNRKYADNIYIRQIDMLERCIADLPAHMYERIGKHKKEWSENALMDLLNSLTDTLDRKELIMGNFLECIELVAEHRAKRFVCTAFELPDGEFDKIEEYAIIEYYRCVEGKNRASNYKIKFGMPIIGIARRRSSNK